MVNFLLKINKYPKLICKKLVYIVNLELLQWRRSNGCEWDFNTCGNEALNGHIMMNVIISKKRILIDQN